MLFQHFWLISVRSGEWDGTEEPSPVIRNGALIGANAIIIGGIEIGEDYHCS